MQQTPGGWLQKKFASPLFQRILKNSSYLGGAAGISAGISMLQGILVARLLGVENYGVLGVITVFISVVNNLLSFRMGELVVKYVGEYNRQDDPIRSAAVFKLAALSESAASILAFCIVVLLAPLAAQIFTDDPSLAGLFSLYGVILLANMAVESSTGLLQLHDRFSRIGMFNVIQGVVVLLLVIVVNLAGGGLMEVVLAYTAGKCVYALGITFLALREARRQWGPGWQRGSLRLLQSRLSELAHFAVHTNLSASISLITKDSELLWVSLFRPKEEVGYYKLALSLANMVQLPINPLPQATYPELTRQADQKHWANFRMILRQGSWLAGAYTLLVTVFLLLFGQTLISWLYTPQYLPAYPALLILLIGFLFANTFYWRRIALLALGKPDIPTKLNALLAGVKVLGILILVPTYGYLASAALLAGFYITGSVITVLKVRARLQEVAVAA